MADIAGFKNYARLPLDDPDDQAAEICFNAALQSSADAGIPEFLRLANDAKYDLYIYALALYWYENRGFMPIGAHNDETRRIMSQMRIELKYRVESVESGESDG